MAITKTTTFNVEAEPPHYHKPNEGESEATLAFAVHRSFAYFDPFLPPNERAARAEFQKFIEQKMPPFDAQKTLYLYKISKESKTIAGEPALATIIQEANNTNLQERLMNWLTNIRGAFFNAELNVEHEISEAVLEELGGNLLRSTANWDAPIPHKLQLSVVARVSGVNFNDNDHLWVIGPAGLETGWNFELVQDLEPDNKAEDDTSESAKDVNVRFFRTNDNGDKDEIVTHALQKFKQPPLVAENGFLNVNNQCVEDFRILKRLEDRSGCLLNILPQLLELEPWLLEFEHQVNNPTEKSQTRTQEQLSALKKWLAEAAVLSALDPILIALHMPGLEHTEGRMLSEWISLLQNNKQTGIPVIKTEDPLKLPDQENEPITAGEVLRKTRTALRLSDQEKGLSIALDVLKIDTNSEFAYLANIINSIPAAGISVQQLFTSVRALSNQLQDELGVERTIIALFRKRRYQLEQELDRTDIDAVINKFEALLANDFNGAEIITRCCSLVFTNLFTLQYSKNSSACQTSFTDAQNILKNSNFFTKRFQLPLDGDSKKNNQHDVFKSTLDLLWPPEPLSLPADLVTELTTRLDTALETVASQLIPDPIEKRFVPDTHPIPLPIRIAPDMNHTKLDEFNQLFNGIGVLIQRENEGWKQACCVTTLLYEQQSGAFGNVIEKFALQPVIPMINDGKAELYLEYQGFPLATQAFAAVGAEGIEQVTVSKSPFYYLHDVQNDGPPALIYGKEYKVASYAVAMSGSLPKAIQKKGTSSLPWYPETSDIKNEDIPNQQVYTTRYQRRTAIGRTSFHHLPNSTAEQRRIGTKYPDVLPVALDYPRLVLGKYEHLDLLRNSDGTGGLDLARLLDSGTSETRVKLTNIKAQNGTSAIKIALFNQPNSTLGAKPAVEEPLFEITQSSLTIIFKKSEDEQSHIDPSDDCITFKLPQNLCTDSWLRISLVEGEAVSFAIPEADRSDKYYSTVSDEEAKFKVVLPRVGFLDFEHWIKNEDAIDHLNWPANAPKLSDILIYAYILRGFSDELASLLDRLPDPAVKAVLVEALPVDQVGDNNGVSHVKKIILNGLPSPVSLSLDDDVSNWELEHFVQLFKAWDKAYTIAVNASCHSNPSSLDITTTLISITVPEGCISRLSVRPLVPNKFINNKSAPLADELKQLAVGRWPIGSTADDGYLLFDGANLLIESMYDKLPLENFVPQIIPQGSLRSYQIQVTEPPVLVSDIQVHTLAWRYSGRPIYNWLNPQPNNTWSKSAALNLLNHDANELLNFETELDFNRDQADFASDPLKRLTPGDTATVLKTVDWPSPTANYFRHRYKLYSRYRGAMLNGTKSVNLSGDNNWQHRVVMLADASRIEITRPQLRAIIPLSSPPDEASVATPPLTCVVQEPPFAYGGLAERVLAGIHTGVGYGFTKQNSAVTAIDTRKEIGKEPRFTVRPMTTDDALSASFLNEGPVGLTFDRSEASAPAWVNSQYIVSPQLLNQNNETVEPETFIAVRMLRMLDPNWVYQHQPSITATGISYEFDLNHCYQATFESENNGNITVAGQNICKVNRNIDESKWQVSIAKIALEPSIPLSEQSDIPLCSASTNLIKSIGLVHRPLADGVYVLLVLGYPGEQDAEARIKNGQPDVPYLLVEICWQLPDKHSDKATFEGCKSVIPFYASASTERQWARTAQSANVVYIKGRDKPVSITELYFEDDKLMLNGEEVLPITKPAETGIPQTVHRHLLTVFTKAGKGLGRPIQEFYSAKLIIDSDWPDITHVSGIRLAEVQTPARPIAAAPARDTAIPARYKNVLFDNHSIGHKETTDYLFIIRAVTPPDNELNFKVKINGEEKAVVSISKNKTIQYFTTHLNNGTKQIVVSLGEMDNEHWFDISMLPLKDSTAEYDYDFDFNWLFTNKGGNTDYQTSVAASQLEQTYEATAQLVSWSNIIKRK